MTRQEIRGCGSEGVGRAGGEGGKDRQDLLLFSHVTSRASSANSSFPVILVFVLRTSLWDLNGVVEVLWKLTSETEGLLNSEAQVQIVHGERGLAVTKLLGRRTFWGSLYRVAARTSVTSMC